MEPNLLPLLYGNDLRRSDSRSGDEVDSSRFTEVWNRKRIGLATAPSVFGPWTRCDEPLISPRDCSHWDCTATTNPAVAIQPDGTTYMLYKSRSFADGPLKIGVAKSAPPGWSV